MDFSNMPQLYLHIYPQRNMLFTKYYLQDVAGAELFGAVRCDDRSAATGLISHGVFFLYCRL